MKNEASLLMLALLAGCSGDRTVDRAGRIGVGTYIEKGDPKRELDQRPPVHLKIKAPADRAIPERGKPIEVECELVIPEGGSMPASLSANILDGRQRVVNGRTMKSGTHLGGGQYVFKASIPCPDKPGIYKLRVRAVESIVRNPSPDDQGDSSSRASVDTVEVRVK